MDCKILYYNFEPKQQRIKSNCLGFLYLINLVLRIYKLINLSIDYNEVFIILWRFKDYFGHYKMPRIIDG